MSKVWQTNERRCGVTIKDEICPTVKVDARLLDDGTLWIKTDKIADIGRVIVEDGKTSCKQFYQDAPEPHWIPCNERLPEEDGEYLVTVKSDYMHYTTRAWFFVKYKIWNKQYDEGGYEARITAWMPTPEPYREEDGS